MSEYHDHYTAMVNVDLLNTAEKTILENAEKEALSIPIDERDDWRLVMHYDRNSHFFAAEYVNYKTQQGRRYFDNCDCCVW